jgi:hypothetical protein
VEVLEKVAEAIAPIRVIMYIIVVVVVRLKVMTIEIIRENHLIIVAAEEEEVITASIKIITEVITVVEEMDIEKMLDRMIIIAIDIMIKKFLKADTMMISTKIKARFEIAS